ncbi:MAG: 50S ribosomal protein L17 [Myxococcales bacterium]|nr:50S ribosomal protein L17 [Myxococcales bacterium]
MRHLKAGRKFGRNTSHRRAMFRNLAGNLVLHERIRTTDAKAKELRRIIERMISRAVRLGEDLTADIGKITDDGERQRVMAARIHAQREVARFLPRRMAKTLDESTAEEVDLVHKLFHEIAPRYVGRALEGKGGGYTRIVKIQRRKGDGAPISVIELVGSEGVGRREPAERAEEE